MIYFLFVGEAMITGFCLLQMDLGRRTRLPALKTLRDDTFREVSNLSIPPYSLEEEFCASLREIVTRTEAQLRILENLSEDLGFNSRMKTGIRAFRRYLEALKFYQVAGDANSDWHQMTCTTTGCIGYCEFHDVSNRESRRIFPEDFDDAIENGQLKT